MSILLTDKELYEASIAVGNEQENIAKAAARKVFDWGDYFCLEHPESSGLFRHECFQCRQTLRQEVGL